MAAETFPKNHTHECPTCRGTGEVVERDGAGHHYTDCPSCAGRGQLEYRPRPGVEREAEPPHEHETFADREARKVGSKG